MKNFSMPPMWVAKSMCQNLKTKFELIDIAHHIAHGCLYLIKGFSAIGITSNCGIYLIIGFSVIGMTSSWDGAGHVTTMSASSQSHKCGQKASHKLKKMTARRRTSFRWVLSLIVQPEKTRIVIFFNVGTPSGVHLFDHLYNFSSSYKFSKISVGSFQIDSTQSLSKLE